MRDRTIGFYEVVKLEAGEQRRMSQIDFPSALAGVATAPLTDRMVEADQTFIGTVYPWDEIDHLLLHRVKDAGEWLSVINLDTGDWQELESQASRGYLETSAVSFLGFGNVIGIMQGSTSAPSHKAVEKWLNGAKLFETPSFVIRPLTSLAEVQRLQQAAGATKIEIRFGTGHAAQLATKKSRLARVLSQTIEEYGDARVTLTITIPRGNGRSEQRQALRDDLLDLSDVMPGSAELAKARLIFADAGGQEYSALAEFVEHHITAKRRVQAVDADGNSIKLSEALRIIMQVAVESEIELRQASDSALP